MQDILKKEVQLVLLLAKPILTEEEVDRLKQLLQSHQNWNLTLGMLQVHRVAGLAWKNIRNYIIQERAKYKAAYFFKALEIMYKGQRQLSHEQMTFNHMVFQKFDELGIKYALVKGAILADWIYEDLGLRLFSDNDVLIEPSQANKVAQILQEHGYVFGHYNFQLGTIDSVKRSEILYSQMTSHQLYSLVKPVKNSSFLEFHKIDIQFSIDFMTKNRTDKLVQQMLNRRTQRVVGGKWPISTLQVEDLLLFTCIHFYKDAIYRNGVERYKDLVLYKAIDIHSFFVNRNIQIDFDTFIKLVNENSLIKEVYFALHYVNELFPDTVPQNLLAALHPGSLDYLSEVLYDGQVWHKWTSPVVERFFNFNRIEEMNSKSGK
ncbi:nucleotidyltransferase family protein [Brevibacillus sp. SAFN-007a]|uniref:nucleotidyltransferase family protein n=1 Tax=Brevibacillus sp. SAFN-007a TaxID=3436862 RepID=UPI003F7E074B